MNLTCFWSRRACSRYAVLDEPIPPGSKLLTHIEKCDGCREYWRSLSLLTTDLELMVDVPSPSRQYLEPIWERVRPTKRAADWGRLTLVGAAACGLLCGWVTWRMGAVPAVDPNPSGYVKLGAPPDEEPIRLPSQQPVVNNDLKAAQASNAALDTGNRMSEVKWTGILPRHRRHGLRRHSAPSPEDLDEAAPPTDWRARGEQLEALGDPGLANAAYQAAYEEHPTEQSAFDMGRSAEESGDMEQAMNVYAGLLSAADARTRTEKGWTP